MGKELILLEANDCSPFQNQETHGAAIQYFIANASKWNMFHFAHQEYDEVPQIAYFNNKDAKWFAGRFVGEARFHYNGMEYQIIIMPRFGMLHLFKMLEEVFNVTFTETKGDVSKTDELNFLIKKVISFLWLNMLARANKHGLPKLNSNNEHKGKKIRGNINVRKSILPLHSEEAIVSNYREKSIDNVIAKILDKAYELLLSQYHLGTINISTNALDAIEQIKAHKLKKAYISEADYRNITYKEIYLSYKPVVDLSWDIIRRKNIGSDQNQSSRKSFSFFIDMAEIWELYLKSLLKRHFAKEGWKLRNDVLMAYEDKDFKRRLIPDIVLQKEKILMVWDAKYKRMHFDFFDYDRNDFFQIHTYINYYNQKQNVIVGGLLYPISHLFDEKRQKANASDSLFGQQQSETKYVVDGIDYSMENNVRMTSDFIKLQESSFINRIARTIKDLNG